MEINFCCVQCGCPVTYNNGMYQCVRCNKDYFIENDVHLFSESKHYYSDLDKSKMNELIKESSEHGWRKTVYERYGDNTFFYRIITDETRADWQYLLPLNKKYTALDIGAGWGTIAIPLARNLEHVVALDGTKDRLDFLKVRAEQENISNITLVHADIFKHPFMENQFDLISFNGVLEWVGVDGDNNVDPKEKQLAALKIAYNLLKDNGYLYIGIENALGLKYVLGEHDDHTNIKYITYLNRNESSELTKNHNGNDYRTFTYSVEGYKDLLEQSGFNDLEFYYPVPDYKRIESIHDLNNPNVSLFLNESQRYSKPISTLNERVLDLERVLIEAGSLIPYPASYSILAQKVVK